MDRVRRHKISRRTRLSIYVLWGRLLSHYTMKEADDMINVLMTNRNAAILIDSDKRTKNSRINDTKKNTGRISK